MSEESKVYLYRAYITPAYLCQLIATAIEIDGRSIEEIAELLEIPSRTFRTIRKYDPKKPHQNLKDRIGVLEKLMHYRVTINPVYRLEIMANTDDMLRLTGRIKDFETEYRGYNLEVISRKRDDGVLEIRLVGTMGPDLMPHEDDPRVIEGEWSDEFEVAYQSIIDEIDEVVDAPLEYRGFFFNYTQIIPSDSDSVYYWAYARKLVDPVHKPRNWNEIEMMLRRGTLVSIEFESGPGPSLTKAAAFNTVRKRIDDYLKKLPD